MAMSEDQIRYMGLAETIEERDPHYLAALGNRKRAVSQLEITVEPGGEDQAALDQASALENWLQRDELSANLGCSSSVKAKSIKGRLGGHFRAVQGFRYVE